MNEQHTEHPRITVFGVGGVGGAVSAKLLKAYGEQVSLIARGRRKEHLIASGLTLHGDFLGDFTVPAPCVTEDPSVLPVQDIVILCVKNDALETAAGLLAPVVGDGTIVVPIMNGVTAYQKLQVLLPQAVVLPSVIYTVSLVADDFSVVQKGAYTHLFVGPLTEKDAPAAQRFHEVLIGADIDCRYSDAVLSEVWKKYILNCAYNVMTARYACNSGEIKHDETKREEFYTLMEEAYRVGLAEGVSLPEDLLKKHMHRLDTTTDDSDSSLSRDYEAHKMGEMEIFCGDVVRMAAKHGLAVPLTSAFYEALQAMAAGWSSHSNT